MTDHVLLVEDDRALRYSLAQTLDLAGIQVTEAGTYIEAKDHIADTFDGVVLTDIRMPGKDGFDVLNLVRDRDAELPVIVLTGEGDIPMAVRAINDGAHDFLTKPCPPETLIRVLRKALELRKLTLKARALERQLERGDIAAVNFPGSSEAVMSLRKDLRRTANLPVGVHLFGPEGCGKRIAAHTLHELSDTSRSFIAINASAIGPDVLKQSAKEAAGGTLCLRWLDDANQDQQQSILALVDASVDFRLVTTSNASLQELHKGGMRADLFYALNVVAISVPPLVDRKEDLLQIFEAFVRQAAQTLNRSMPDLTTNLRTVVASRDWQANLPELRSFAQRVALGIEDREIQPEKSGLTEQIEAFERSVIAETLARNGGKATAAAAELNLPRKTFYDKLKRHNLKPEDFKLPPR